MKRWRNAKILSLTHPDKGANLHGLFWIDLLAIPIGGVVLSYVIGKFASGVVQFGFATWSLWYRDWLIARKFPSRVTKAQLLYGAGLIVAIVAVALLAGAL